MSLDALAVRVCRHSLTAGAATNLGAGKVRPGAHGPTAPAPACLLTQAPCALTGLLAKRPDSLAWQAVGWRPSLLRCCGSWLATSHWSWALLRRMQPMQHPAA